MNCPSEPARRPRAASPGAAALALAIAIGTLGPAAGTALAAEQPPPFAVIDVSMAMDPDSMSVDGRRAAFGAEEFDQGVDLNGDGDAADAVLHVYDAASGALANRQVAVNRANPHALAWYRSDVLAVAREADARRDYNGDGDQLDLALLQVNPATGAVRFLQNGVRSVLVVGDHAVVARSESSLNLDLNGDGDRLDQVPAILAIPTRKLAPLHHAVQSLYDVVTTPSTVAFLAWEGSNGRDLNNDGDQLDKVVFVHDIAAKRTTNTKLQGTLVFDNDHAWDHRTQGPLLAFSTNESQHGADLNGDGDTQDPVPFVVEPGSHALHRAIPGKPSLPQGSSLPLVAYESGQQDLNGDGDMADRVFAIWREPGGDYWLTGMEAVGFAGWAFDALGRATGEVDELRSQTDLNGDGDFVDVLPALFDPVEEQVEVLGAASDCGNDFRPLLVASGAHMMICGREGRYASDFTGDGDTLDLVLIGLDMTSGALRVSGLAMGFPNLQPKVIGEVAYVAANEATQGMDIKGDGDQQDNVVFRFEPASGATSYTGLSPYVPGQGVGWQAGSHEVFVAASEYESGTDHNHDGDTSDYVLHVVR